MFVGVVLNPLARKNRAEARARVARLSAALGPHGEVRLTRSTDELGDAVEALLPRATHLVSDGGDGALNWLIDAVRTRVADPERWPVFAPTNGGTIDFVARKVGIRGRSLGIVRVLVAAAAADRPPPVTALDSLHLTGTTRAGEPFDRVGFAMAAGGVGNRFFDKYYEDPEPRPMTIVKVIARTVSGFALSRVVPPVAEGGSYAAHLFRPTRARVSIDGAPLAHTEHACIHAGAFDVNLGGVLRVFPFAREDGVIHYQAGHISPVGMILNLPALASGGEIRGPLMRDTAGTTMTIEAIDEALAPILDGEKFHDLERLTIEPGPRVRFARVRA